MNETWSDYVLSEFPSEEAFARVTLVEDPDTLLADETIFAKFNQRRYRVVEFATPIALGLARSNREPRARSRRV